MERIERSSRTPTSTEQFSTMKVKGDFLAWLKRESVRRGIYLYELVEEIASSTLAGKKPWRDRISRSIEL